MEAINLVYYSENLIFPTVSIVHKYIPVIYNLKNRFILAHGFRVLSSWVTGPKTETA